MAAPPQAQQQPQPGLVRRWVKSTFDTYVPPHVQARDWKTPPTWADLKAAFKNHIHLPELPIRHWARNYSRQVRGVGLINGVLTPGGRAGAGEARVVG